MAVTMRTRMEPRPAIFLDKDGTLLENVPFNAAPRLMRFCDGVDKALARLSRFNVPLVVVSNQSGIAHGYISEVDMNPVQQKLGEMFARCGATLAGFYYCPHHPKGTVASYAIACECRKPNPGMFFRAARDLTLSLSDSWMVGDILDDIAAAKQAGCRAILLDNGGETEWNVDAAFRRPDYVVADFLEATDVITALRGEVAKLDRRAS